MKTVVRIKDPELGNGTYLFCLAEPVPTDDAGIIARVCECSPSATAVLITREYPCAPRRRAA